ncbi:hypothetical protein [Streptomyces sp. NPDC047024]|uniref:hypothetical protein n=1 Tax=Streptomyces sp. NPDC047024 TaxID=3155476 RepID=UPI0033C5BB07
MTLLTGTTKRGLSDRREEVSALFSVSMTGVRPMPRLCETSSATRETSRPSMRVRRSEIVAEGVEIPGPGVDLEQQVRQLDPGEHRLRGVLQSGRRLRLAHRTELVHRQLGPATAFGGDDLHSPSAYEATVLVAAVNEWL